MLLLLRDAMSHLHDIDQDYVATHRWDGWARIRHQRLQAEQERRSQRIRLVYDTARRRNSLARTGWGDMG
jgi:hypothetical protein